VKNVKIRKREIGSAMVLAVLVATLAAYSHNLYVKERSFSGTLLLEPCLETTQRIGNEPDERVKQIRETIEGELKKGTFESVVSQLEELTDQKEGFVSSLYITYRDELWNGEMVSQIPQKNTTSFVFETRNLIDKSGKVISITMSITDITGKYAKEEVPYATIRMALKETTGLEPPEPIVQVLSILPLLTTCLVWIAEGLIVGVPLCFVSLGVVLLVNRGILPVWKKQLRKSQ